MRSSRREVAELNASSIELPELPPTWAACKLGDVASLQPGYAFKSSWFEPTGVRLLRGINIEPNRVRWKDSVCVTPERARDFDAYALQANDVVIAMDRPIISSGLKVTMLSEQDVPSLLLQRVGRFKVKQGLDREYLFRFLNSDIFVAHIGGQATGTQLPHISGTDIETAPFPLPPFVEQRRIVAKLDTLATRSRRAKEALDAIPALLDRFRQAVLEAAFRGDLTADWREQNPDVEPAAELLKRIRAERRRRWEEAELSKMRAKGRAPGDDRWKERYEEPAPVDTIELPELPEGWAWASLDEVTSIVGGITKGQKRRSNEVVRLVPYLRVANVQRGYLDLNEVKEIEATEREILELRLKPGDILLNEGGDRDKLGRGWIWSGEIRDCIHQNHVFRARPFVTELQPKYISHYANTFGQAFFVDAGKQTTNLASVSLSRVRRFPIALPPAREQIEIVRKLDGYMACLLKIDISKNESINRLNDLDRAILAKAFRGKLVSQDPDDEPASATLERLRAETIQGGKPTNSAGRSLKMAPPESSNPNATRGRRISAAGSR
ncbi:restriction endonuclease subunit S [Sorangium sp. So ce134]